MQGDMLAGLMNVLSTDEPKVFLFTDIEGSTRIWETFPDAMTGALALHDQILAQATQSTGGRVFKSVGDALCAVFPDESSAMQAAIEGQRRLAEADWRAKGIGEPLRVRMAIQSGPATKTGDDFAGPVLNRLSRLLKAAHGGQVLLTGEIGDALDGALPSGVMLRDFGERRLRDVPGRVRISQLVISGLPSDFPSIRTLDPISSNLPAPVDQFVGRETERERLNSLLSGGSVRLVTLLGPGGIGKTRLAIEAGRAMVDEFADGVWFVDLTGLGGDDQLAGTLMRVFGQSEHARASDAEVVLEWFSDREVLLLLDNCEQVVDSVAHFAAEILRTAPGVKIVATSRIPLEIRGEHRLPLEPLALPSLQDAIEVQGLMEIPSVTLFVIRASSAQPSFSLDTGNAPDVAAICMQVEGIPLALEIAAARVDQFSIGELRSQLSQRLQTLTTRQRDLPERHQTLRSAISWSYELLSDPEKEAFCQVAIFSGGWAEDAARAVVRIQESPDPCLAIESLVAKSLVRQTAGMGEESRYQMLETIRELALEIQESMGNQATTAGRHADYFAHLGIHNEDELFGPDQNDWFDRIELDYLNFLAAIERFIDLNQNRAQQLATALYQFWYVRGSIHEGLRVLERVLANADATDIRSVARATHAKGNLLVRLSRFPEARAAFLRSEKLRRQIGDSRGVAAAEINLGFVARELGDLDLARSHLQGALDILGPDGPPEDLATIYLNLSHIALELQHHQEAKTSLRESNELFRRAGDRYGVANSLARLAAIARIEGNHAAARSMLDEACAESAILKDESGVAFCNHARAQLALDELDTQIAARELCLAIDRLTILGDQKMLLETLVTACQVLIAAGQPHRAAQLMVNADAGFSALEIVRSPSVDAAFARVQLFLRDELAESDRSIERSSGQSLAFEDAVSMATGWLREL